MGVKDQLIDLDGVNEGKIGFVLFDAAAHFDGEHGGG